MFEGLVGTEPGTADPAPLLATSGRPATDGLTYTFTLEEGVKFHDGTDFNAEAVCSNFDRWYNWTGVRPDRGPHVLLRRAVPGLRHRRTTDAAIYESLRRADDDRGHRHAERSRSPRFVAALSLPAFSMQSPTALEEYDADDVGGTRTTRASPSTPPSTRPAPARSSSTRGTRPAGHPRSATTTTGATRPRSTTVIISPSPTRRPAPQALRPARSTATTWSARLTSQPLKDDGFQILNRPAFNILYLGMNQAARSRSTTSKVRQAIAYAIDKEAIVNASLPEGTEPRRSSCPTWSTATTPTSTTYDYDPEKAKELLEEAGAGGPDARVRLPDRRLAGRTCRPRRTPSTSIQTQLEAVGIKVTPTADQWRPGLPGQDPGHATKHDIHLLGWTGDYNDPDNFLGVFFGQQVARVGLRQPGAVRRARRGPRAARRVEEQTPVVRGDQRARSWSSCRACRWPTRSRPWPSPRASRATQPSPVQDEVWNIVTVPE